MDAVKQIGKGLTYFGEKLLVNAANLNVKSENYQAAYQKIAKLLDSAGYINDPDLSKLAGTFIDGGNLSSDKYNKLSDLGGNMKVIGGALNVGAAGFDVYKELSEYNAKVGNGTANVLDTAQASVNAIKAVVSVAAPGIGGLLITAADLVVDVSAYSIDYVLEKGRDKSSQEAKNIINMYNNAWNVARNEVLESAKNGKPLTSLEIVQVLRKQGSKLTIELIELEKNIGNRIADGDVTVEALGLAESSAQNMKSMKLDDNLISLWVKKSTLLALDFELKNISISANSYQKEIEKTIDTLNEIKTINEATSDFTYTLSKQEIIKENNLKTNDKILLGAAEKEENESELPSNILSAQDIKKAAAIKLQIINTELAAKYMSLLAEGKNLEAQGVATILNANAQQYNDLRATIQNTEPGWGPRYDTSETVTKRFNNLPDDKLAQVNNLRDLESETINALVILREAEVRGSSIAKINALLTDIAAKLGMDKNELRLQAENILIQTQRELIALGENPLPVSVSIANKLNYREEPSASTALAGLESQARQQLVLQEKQESISSQISSLSQQQGGYSDLLSQKSEYENQLRQIEQQLSGAGSISPSGSQFDVDKVIRYLEAFTYAANLYNKYNGDYSRLTGEEIVGMKIRSTLIFGTAASREQLFNISSQMVVSTQRQLDNYNASSKQISLTASSGNNLEQQRQVLLSKIETVNSQLNNEQSSQLRLLQLERDQMDTLIQLDQNREYLAKLVADIRDLNKFGLATQQINNNQQVNYAGYLSTATSTFFGVIIDRVYGPTSETIPYLGMDLDLTNSITGGVYSGDFEATTFNDTDTTAGTYSYLSWGTWAASLPAQSYTDHQGNVTALAGGLWLIGLESRDIPKQGSAYYRGGLTGDYSSATEGYLPGKIDGYIDFTANFANGTLQGQTSMMKDNVLWAGPSFAVGTFDQNHGGFHAGLTGGTGEIIGQFFGPNGTVPPEAGGTWWFINNDMSRAAGVFRAKKQ